MLLKSIRLEIYHIIDPWNCVTVQKERLFVLHRRIKSPNATQSADRYRISRFLEYMLKRRFRTFPDWAHRDSPGVLSFFCLWLVMWSNSNSKNSTAKKSAKSKKKSAIFSRKQRISWSCYPDLNWRPHPYQLIAHPRNASIWCFGGVFVPENRRQWCFPLHCLHPLVSCCGSGCGSRRKSGTLHQLRNLYS